MQTTQRYYIEVSTGPRDEKCAWHREPGNYATHFEAMAAAKAGGIYPYRIKRETVNNAGGSDAPPTPHDANPTSGNLEDLP